MVPIIAGKGENRNKNKIHMCEDWRERPLRFD